MRARRAGAEDTEAVGEPAASARRPHGAGTAGSASIMLNRGVHHVY